MANIWSQGSCSFPLTHTHLIQNVDQNWISKKMQFQTERLGPKTRRKTQSEEVVEKHEHAVLIYQYKNVNTVYKTGMLFFLTAKPLFS